MKIAIIAFGTRGDVQPLIAVGVGLKSAGCDVRIATDPKFRDLVCTLNLEYHELNIDMESILQTADGIEWLTAGRNIWKTITQMTKLWHDHFQNIFPDIRSACEGVDAILFSYLGMGACHVGEKLGIPCIGLWPTPVTVMPNPDMTIALPGRSPYWFGGRLGAVAHYATEQMVWQTFGRAQNDWRAQLGLAPIRFPGIVSHFRKRKIPFLYGFSPKIVKRADAWPSYYRITGYWLLEKLMSWDPPKDLEDFINKGDPPLYIGFGSMSTWKPRKLVEMAVNALGRVNCRGIISTGWTGLKASEIKQFLPDTVLPVDYVSHEWLFPKVKGIVHHGGASTTGAALYAGKPSCIVHFFADQAFWGDKLYYHGVATKPLSFLSLTPEKLAVALEQLLNDSSIIIKSKEMAQALAGEDGIKKAAESTIELLERKP